jgi:hypothetical protein
MSNKPEFDPNQPFEVAAKPAFDPTQPFDYADKDAVPMAASGAAGFFKGIPFAPQIGAATKTGMDVITGITSPSDLIQEYRDERDRLSQDLNAKASAHPIISTLGSFAGMASLPIGGSPADMAKYGAAQGLADSRADLTKGQLGQAAIDTAKGGAMGYASGKVAEIAAPYIKSAMSDVANDLRGFAREKAVAATGATGLQAAKFADNTGDVLLDNNLVGFGDSQAQIAAKAQAALDRSGQNIGDTLTKLDSQGVRVDRNTVIQYIKDKIASLAGNEGEKPLVNQLKQKIEDIEEQLPEPITQQTGVRPGGQLTMTDHVQDALPNLRRPTLGRNPNGQFKAVNTPPTIDNIAPEVTQVPAEQQAFDLPQPVPPTPDSTIPIGKAEEIKRSFDAASKWNGNSDAAALEGNRTAANAYREASEQAALQANPDLASLFQKNKDLYHTLSPVVTAANKRAFTTAQSPPGGFLDTTASAAGSLVAGTPGTLLAPVARRIIAPRINSSLAVGSNFLSSVVRNSPQTLGKWAPVLTRAAARGGNALGATDYLLQQTDPEYREHLRMLQNPNEINQNTESTGGQ